MSRRFCFLRNKVIDANRCVVFLAHAIRRGGNDEVHRTWLELCEKFKSVLNFQTYRNVSSPSLGCLLGQFWQPIQHGSDSFSCRRIIAEVSPRIHCRFGFHLPRLGEGVASRRPKRPRQCRATQNRADIAQPHPDELRASTLPLQGRVVAAPGRLFLAVRLWGGLAVHAGER
jgi:hypothetical protein